MYLSSTDSLQGCHRMLWRAVGERDRVRLQNKNPRHTLILRVWEQEKQGIHKCQRIQHYVLSKVNLNIKPWTEQSQAVVRCQSAACRDACDLEELEQPAEKTGRGQQPRKQKHLYTAVVFCLSHCCLWPVGLVITINSWIENVGMGAEFLDQDISHRGTLLRAGPGSSESKEVFKTAMTTVKCCFKAREGDLW